MNLVLFCLRQSFPFSSKDFSRDAGSPFQITLPEPKLRTEALWFCTEVDESAKVNRNWYFHFMS